MTCSLCISGSQFHLVYKTVTVIVWQWSRQPSTIITFMKTVKKNCACLRCQHSVWVFFFSKCQTVLSPHYFTTAGQKRRRKKVRTSHYPSEDLNYRAGFWVSNLDFFFVVILNLVGGETIKSDLHFVIAVDLQPLVNHWSPIKKSKVKISNFFLSILSSETLNY